MAYGLKAAIVTASVAACVLMVIPAAAWQRQVSALMGIEGPSTLRYLRTLLIAVLVGGALVGVARVVLDAIRALARYLIRRWHVNDEIALFIGTAIVAVLIITLVNGVLIRGFFAGASRVFQPQNASTRPGITQPTQPERSGSPASFADWDTLGYQGRMFVSTGPHADELAELNGRPAKEPIRIYAGLATADTDAGPGERDPVSELERTGAFDRKLLVIVPTTGTGWVDPIAARSIESMYNGDTAMVAMQYSYLPSWISFLADEQRSMESGKQLIDAVQGRWAAAAASAPAEVGAVRRKPRVDGRSGRVRLPAGHRTDGLLVGAVGRPAEREPAVARADGAPRPGHPGGRAALRRWPHGAVLCRGPTSPVSRQHRGTAPACCSCSTHPTPSCGGHRICCSTGRTGSSSRRAPTAPR